MKYEKPKLEKLDAQEAILGMESAGLTDTETYRMLVKIWEEQTGVKWQPTKR